MRTILRFLKRIWFLNFVRRLYTASKYYNKKYIQIIKWGFSSKEDTNYTYNLKEDNQNYLAQTTSVVTGVGFATIKSYFDELLENDELVIHIQNSIKKSKFSKFADLEIRYGRRIGWYAFVRALKPKIVVETGVDKGLGSVILSSALKKNKEEGFDGYYYGTDINPEAGYLFTDIYSNFGEILYGDSIESLKKLNKTIDIFINDSDHSADYEYQEYQTITPLLNNKSIILGDNSHKFDPLSRYSIESNRKFLFFKEKPLNHWYPGAGIGISYL